MSYVVYGVREILIGHIGHKPRYGFAVKSYGVHEFVSYEIIS